MKRLLTFFFVAYIVLFCTVFTHGQVSNPTTSSATGLRKKCPSTFTISQVQIDRLGNIDLNPCPTRQVRINGSPISGSPGSGVTSINGLNVAAQLFATGTAGTDFNIVSGTATHTFNFPTVSGANRGLVTPALFNTWNGKLSGVALSTNVLPFYDGTNLVTSFISQNTGLSEINITGASLNVSDNLTADNITGLQFLKTGATANSFSYFGAGGTIANTAAATNGQLLIGRTGATPLVANLTAGTGINITNGAGSITISATGGGGGGTPGGADTQLQFNDAGVFGGDSGLIFNKTTDLLTVGGNIALATAGTRQITTGGTELSLFQTGATQGTSFFRLRGDSTAYGAEIGTNDATNNFSDLLFQPVSQNPTKIRTEARTAQKTDSTLNVQPEIQLFHNTTKSATFGSGRNYFHVPTQFTTSATRGGLNVGSVAGDPSAPSNGDLWYDSTANELTARINGANVALGAGGGGAASSVQVVGSLPGTNSQGYLGLLNTGRLYVGTQTNTLAEVPLANTSGSSANQILGLNAANNGFETKTLTAGSGVTITHGANSVTIAATGGGGASAIREDLLKGLVNPDTTGRVTLQPYTTTATNDFWRNNVWNFDIPTADEALYGTFETPAACASGAGFQLTWTSTATTGTVQWSLAYRVVTGDNTNSLDQATAQETLTASDTAPTATDRRMIVNFTPTNANFSAAATVQWRLTRLNASDNLAAAVQVPGLRFQCTQ